MKYPYVVADIGGTNARFGLVTGKDSKTGEFVVEKKQTFKCASFSTFEDVYVEYFKTFEELPKRACVAIAGPVMGDRVEMTNLNWAFSIERMRSQLELDAFFVINDFVAHALSVVSIAPSGLIAIKKTDRNPNETALLPKAIMGPGTGLGVASLVHNGKSWMAIPGEGGHANFAPVTDLDIELYTTLMKTEEYISLETLLCGSGLTRTYKALASIHNKTIELENSRPEAITLSALDRSDDLAVETLSVFCRVLGSAAGNIALTVGAAGGVYLAGGILPRVSDFLLSSEFNSSFSQKGVMGHYVAEIPVNLVVHKDPALIGSAAYLYENI